MEDPDMKKEYDDLLGVYSRKRGQCETMQRQIPLLKAQIDQLKINITNYVSLHGQSTQTTSAQRAEKEKHELIKHYQELKSILNQEEFESSRLTQNIDKDKKQLQTQLAHLQAQVESVIFIQNTNEIQQAALLAQSTKRKVEEEQHKIDSLQRQVENEQGLLRQLQREIAALNEVKQKQGRSKNNQNLQLYNLENQLKKLEQQEASLSETVKKEQGLLTERKRKSDSQEKALNDQLIQVKNTNSKQKNTLAKLEEDLHKLQTKGLKSQLQSQIKKLEESNKNFSKEIDSLNKQVAEKKELEAKRKEQAKKEKLKEKKNFKHQTIEEQTLSELLNKQLQREEAKLQNTIKVRKTYVSNQSLQILQKQYERHQLKNKPNLQAETNKSQKLVRERQIIKTRIQFLKKSAKQLQIENQTALRQLRRRGDDLVNEKLANQKTISQSTYKLNQYMKEFPDHQKKKEEAKNEEKKRKQEVRRKSKIQQQQKDSLIKKKLAKESQIERALQEDPDETAWQKWDKQWDKGSKLNKKDEASLFNKKPFQIAAAVIAVISILVLSFN